MPSPISRRTLLSACAAAVAAPSSAAFAQSNWPAVPIQMVVPFAPGGQFDSIGRAVAEQLSKAIGGTVIVLNKPGAGGMVGGTFVSKAKPDGYTLLLGGPGTLAINPQLVANPPYDSEKNFEPIAYVGECAYFFVTRPDIARDMAGFISRAKAQPGKLTYSSPGIGSNLNLTVELFKMKTGTDLVHVPYPGTGPAIVDLMSGNVQMTVAPEVVLPQIKSGKLVAIAVSTHDRSPLLPEIPTLAEVGVPGAESSGWYGLLAPAGTPRPIIEKLNAAMNKVLRQPEFRQQSEKFGLEIETGGPELLAKKVHEENLKWANVIKTSNIKPQ